jgi:predicted methyltransferase
VQWRPSFCKGVSRCFTGLQTNKTYPMTYYCYNSSTTLCNWHEIQNTLNTNFYVLLTFICKYYDFYGQNFSLFHEK